MQPCTAFCRFSPQLQSRSLARPRGGKNRGRYCLPRQALSTKKRDHVDEAILVLSRLARSGAKRRGRPPKWMTDQNSAAPKRRGRPPGSKMSAANRKAHSERMKQYWAERRKQKSK
jgi:hypothetical protein